MITSTSKLSQSAVEQTGDFIFRNFMFIEGSIPQPSTADDVSRFLRREAPSWSILASEHPLALFKMDLTENHADLERFSIIKDNMCPLTDIVSTLRSDLRKMGATRINVKVPKSMATHFIANGFEGAEELVQFVGRPVETRMMPLLRLSNVTEKEVHDLAKVLHDAYTTHNGKKFLDTEQAETWLREIVRGNRGRYISEASFLSGSPTNYVSACLMTMNSADEANIVELFTHPLYRARGLATTELAAGMNWLVKNKVESLKTWIPSSNDIAYRLFSKIGLQEDRRVIGLTAKE
ncbi:MAG TPA: hypothetical protein VLV18_02815 [Terriglobales bacterium]|nr:hypothetical protein [Terriglobales bacterium]